MKVRPYFRFGGAPLLVAAALRVLTGAATAQTANALPRQERPVERCRGAEYRELDFWVGTWEVRNPEGELVGHNEVRRVAGGCGLVESWRGVSGGRGMSINTYDADRGGWTQRWVGKGATLWLEGGLEEGRMVLTGTLPGARPGAMCWTE